ncbi:type III-B CRISPR-associated protein Cas10/Cmr2 [Paenibacillus glufosinatiresistens]|uniref:type III-B CRISPR-associated protein Cas10/Cmr2 n=1 Tax=Paenibacillus glufosinatiresistens TaxID=3070657 RepID=UPI00286D82EE|nr:type III-B CRISPR-associated protein Cas10/Cmr2 [Paenibacillus sp. YX.27]
MEEILQKQQTLIVISLGPVQDFIAQARKTRDLWFGSFLLSELSRAAALRLRQEGELVMPFFAGEMEDFNDQRPEERLPVANKIIGVTSHPNPSVLLEQIHEAVLERWNCYATRTQKLLDREGLILTEMWRRQIKDFVEFNAAWAPMPDADSYSVTLERVNQILAGRKTLRDFRQNEPSQIYGDKKSSLNPGRESVLKERRYKDYARYGISKSETLDAVSLVKRLSNRIIDVDDGQSTFRSVCDLAFQPFRMRLMDEPELEKKASELYSSLLQIMEKSNLKLPEKIASALKASDFDARLFYPQQMEDMVNEYGSKTVEEPRKLVQQLRRHILEWSSQYALAPSPYYAFLLCDGDRIGDRLREVRTLEGHRLWTKRLSEFAAGSRIVIQKNGGQFIYGGGDDCMALLPLDTCLEAVDELRQNFAGIMQDDDSSIQPSLSAGLVIAHMLEPIGEVRQLAEAAERGAKRQRNSLFVHVQKRSGSNQLQVTLPWSEEPVVRLRQWKQLYRDKQISVQLAHDTRLLHDTYTKRLHNVPGIGSGPSSKENKEVIVQELNRLLRKKGLDQVPVQGEEGDKISLSEWVAWLFQKYGTSGVDRLHSLAEEIMLAITLTKMEVDRDVVAY